MPPPLSVTPASNWTKLFVCFQGRGGGDPRMRYGAMGGQGGRGGYGAVGGRSGGIAKPRSMRGFRDATGQLIIDHDEENLSDKELYARNIPAIGQHHLH